MVGLVDPRMEIGPNVVDFVRRSADPGGVQGGFQITRAHLALSGKTLFRGAAVSRPITRGHVTVTGRAIGHTSTDAIARGALVAHGRQLTVVNVTWSTIPDLLVDRSTTLPWLIPNIRGNYLIAPVGAAVSGSLLNTNLAGETYDFANDRISITVNPGVDTSDSVAMQVTGAGGQNVLSNNFTIYVKSLATFPAAGVPLLDAQGNSAGFGGTADDPLGAFFGMTGFGAGDKWWAENVPVGATVTPLAGGSFNLAITVGMTPGSYAFDAVRWTATTNVITRKQIPFTVT